MSKRENNLVKLLIFLTFVALAAAGCSLNITGTGDDGGSSGSVGSGSVSLKIPIDRRSVAPSENILAAVIDTSTITALNVTVKGPGIASPITATATVAPTDTSVSITVEDIPIGPNRVVLVEAVGATSNPSGTGNPTLGGLIPDFVAGDNILLINQGSTPAAKVYDGLLTDNFESKAFDLPASVVFAVTDRVLGTDSTFHRPTGSDYLIDPLTGADEFVNEVVDGIKNLTKTTSLIVESDLLPIVTGISPGSGSADDSVTISGYGLDGATVTFDSISATVASSSGTSLGVTVPNVPGGSTTVLVSANSGSDSTTFTTVPKIGSITANVAGFVAGESVTITGTGFDASASGNNTIKFGTVSATVTVATSTELTVTVPANLSGTTAITVTVGTQESTSSSVLVVDLGSFGLVTAEVKSLSFTAEELGNALTNSDDVIKKITDLIFDVTIAALDSSSATLDYTGTLELTLTSGSEKSGISVGSVPGAGFSITLNSTSFTSGSASISNVKITVTDPATFFSSLFTVTTVLGIPPTFTAELKADTIFLVLTHTASGKTGKVAILTLNI